MASIQTSFSVTDYDEDPSHGSGTSALLHNEYVVIAQPSEGSSVAEPVLHPSSGGITKRWFLYKPRQILQDLFLPVNYPDSVRPTYLEYQLYDSLQGLCSYLRGVLCSAQVLSAVGVGNANATALAAAITWAMTDGISMLSGLCYSYIAAPRFDSHVKEFRLLADILNDLALCADMLAPYVASFDSRSNSKGGLYLVTAFSGICKTACGISAGAVKSSITQHYALAGNVADLNAKESTQETLVSLIGMVLGMVLAKHLHGLKASEYENSHAEVLQWIVFLLLTFVHLWANYRGVALLRLRTLNRERASIVLHPLVDHWKMKSLPEQSKLDSVFGGISAPESVYESILASSLHLLWSGRLHLGVRLSSLLTWSDAAFMWAEFHAERYVVNVDVNGHVGIALLATATPSDELKSFLHGMLLMEKAKECSADLSKWSGRSMLISQTHQKICAAFSDGFSLVRALEEKGWQVEDRVYLGFSRRRSRWVRAKKNE